MQQADQAEPLNLWVDKGLGGNGIYRVSRETALSEGFELDSPPTGVLRKKDEIIVLEWCLLRHPPTMRVRCAEGWCSERGFDHQLNVSHIIGQLIGQDKLALTGMGSRRRSSVTMLSPEERRQLREVAAARAFEEINQRFQINCAVAAPTRAQIVALGQSLGADAEEGITTSRRGRSGGARMKALTMSSIDEIGGPPVTSSLDGEAEAVQPRPLPNPEAERTAECSALECAPPVMDDPDDARVINHPMGSTDGDRGQLELPEGIPDKRALRSRTNSHRLPLKERLTVRRTEAEARSRQEVAAIRRRAAAQAAAQRQAKEKVLLETRELREETALRDAHLQRQLLEPKPEPEPEPEPKAEPGQPAPSLPCVPGPLATMTAGAVGDPVPLPLRQRARTMPSTLSPPLPAGSGPKKEGGASKWIRRGSLAAGSALAAAAAAQSYAQTADLRDLVIRE